MKKYIKSTAVGRKTNNATKLCLGCFSSPCACVDHCGPASFSLGITLAAIYLAGVLVAFFLPAFYSYLGYVLFHGSIAVNVGDFTGTTVLSGAIAWFLLGIVINAVYYHAKKVFGCK